MKRILGLILTAVFLSALSIPCGATGTETTTYRDYPGFSDVAEGSASYEAIKLYYERGLMNGTSDTAFNPQGKLTVAQLVVLAARLYDLQCGGDGTIPPDLPDLSGSYLRFYDGEGNLMASCSKLEELPSFSGGGESFYAALSEAPDDESLPEACTVEIGYEGYNRVKSLEGVRETYHPVSGAMNHGLTGTGYRFQVNPDALYTRPSAETVERLKGAWWFPAAFYLASEGVMSMEGGLVLRASGWDYTNDSGYDPLTRFSQDHATRALFAWLVDLTAGPLEAVNETVNVPDVEVGETRDAEAILRLYQAGVLTGVDAEGNFNGSGELTRAQAAMMLARVLEPSLRVRAV